YGELAEVRPVNLPLVCLQGAQPQVRLRDRPRSVAGDNRAEVIGAARIAALAHHVIQPRLGGFSEFSAPRGQYDDVHITGKRAGQPLLQALDVRVSRDVQMVSRQL